MPEAIEEYLCYCPRCGGRDLDRTAHASPGTAACRGCQTVFSLLRVHVGESVIAVEPRDEPAGED